VGRVETSGIARAGRGRLTSRVLIDGLLKQGVLVGITGAGRNLLKVRPPMIFSKENTDQLVDALERALRLTSTRR
jgi:4-aminobutyrate aminotransferase-like enzyme